MHNSTVLIAPLIHACNSALQPQPHTESHWLLVGLSPTHMATSRGNGNLQLAQVTLGTFHTPVE
jgi:hypothetical protein